MNAVDERSKEDLAAAVKLLRARMGQLEEQLERMRLRVNGLERTVSSVVEMDYPAFCAAARDAYDRLNQQNRGFVGVVPIPELRRTLGPRLSRAVFEENLVKLHQEGLVQLITTCPDKVGRSVCYDDRPRNQCTHNSATVRCPSDLPKGESRS